MSMPAHKPNALPRPHVLIVSHLFPTPADPTVGPWLAEQVDALTEFVDVEVLCCARTGAGSVTVRDSGAHVTYRDTTTLFGSGHVGLLTSSWRYARHLSEFLRRSGHRPDIIHSHFGFPDAVVVGREARRLGIPHVTTLHGSDVARVLPRQDPLGRSLRSALRRADAVLCVSEALASDVRRATGGELSVSVIRNGVDADLFNVPSGGERNGILFVGALKRVKNPDLLIESYSQIHESVDMPLTLVGDGPMRQGLERRVHELGLESKVTFAGRLDRPEVAALMKRSMLLVLPSSREGWGQVVAEALACGTPVVASNVGGIPEILGSDSGALVPRGDATALAAAIASAARKEWDASTVAAGSRAPLNRESAERLSDLYRELAS